MWQMTVTIDLPTDILEEQIRRKNQEQNKRWQERIAERERLNIHFESDPNKVAGSIGRFTCESKEDLVNHFNSDALNEYRTWLIKWLEEVGGSYKEELVEIA